MEEALQDCFTRHLNPAQSHGLILSGGLDSRTIAGAMKQLNIPFTAFSFGSVDDIEMQCATAVAKSLRLDHHIVPVRMERYTDYAENECKWNHLANGLNTLMFHEPIPAAAQLPGGMLSGFAMDHVIGGSVISWAGDNPDRMCFETYSKKVHRWSIPVQAVKTLVAKRYGVEIVDAVLQRLEQIYNGCAEREFQKAWLFTHYHRVRYHTSAVLGMHSRWPWPVVPYIDTRMLDLIAGMPYEHIGGRRMQYHMLTKRYPNLARLPLDRNSFNMKPVASPYGRVINHLLYKPRELFYRWTSGLRERRFYYRSMDFNAPGWNAVRIAAEPHRKKVLQIFDEAALAEILPRPGEPVAVPDGIIDTSKMKLMTGFLLWSANNL
jgi:asparagine synthase (glutamine-hydrolysing)